MSLAKFLGRWMPGDGPESEIVLSSRIRLARNLNSFPFPERASADELKEIIGKVEEALKGKENLSELKLIRFLDLPAIERLVLVEKHLVSPQHGQKELGALLLKDDGSISVMVNEEDHLRIQCILPGLQLEEAWQQADRIDDLLSSSLDIAYDPELGYLTCCPTNLGTGIRVSVMIHLPALAYLGRLEAVLRSITQVGLAVRGIYGEGTQALGNIFQISNNVTLGRNEAGIVDNITRITKQLVEHEKNARDILVKNWKIKLEDLTGRAYGILSNSYIINSEESIKLLSDLRLGVDRRVISSITEKISRQTLNELLVQIRPGHLQSMTGQELDEEQRDIARAALLRKILKNEREG